MFHVLVRDKISTSAVVSDNNPKKRRRLNEREDEISETDKPPEKKIKNLKNLVCEKLKVKIKSEQHYGYEKEIIDGLVKFLRKNLWELHKTD